MSDMEDLQNFIYRENILSSSRKQNPTDYERYFQLQESIDKKMEKVNRERVISERKRNLVNWSRSLPARWRGASLNSIDNEASREVAKKIKKYPNSSFYFRGDPGAGKTYLAYATLRRLIGSGATTPSRIQIIGEDTILGYSKEGFRGRDAFNKLFNEIYNVYVFDNIGSKEVYDEREISFWEQLIDHVYSNSLIAIFTSPVSARRFASILSGSTRSKFSFLIENRIILVRGGKYPEISDIEEDSVLRHFSDE